MDKNFAFSIDISLCFAILSIIGFAGLYVRQMRHKQKVSEKYSKVLQYNPTRLSMVSKLPL
jgi:hypothetical protein